MPGLEAPLSEAAAACVHAYRVGSNAVLALVQADVLAMETAAVLTLSPEFQVSIGSNGLEPPLGSGEPAKTFS